MKTIPIKVVSLKYQKLVEDRGCQLELFDDYIKYKVKFSAEEPLIEQDENSGWETVNTDFEVIALKKNIAGIEKTWLDKSKRWKVNILVNGFGTDIQTYYKKETEAIEIYKSLLEYITNGCNH